METKNCLRINDLAQGHQPIRARTEKGGWPMTLLKGCWIYLVRLNSANPKSAGVPLQLRAEFPSIPLGICPMHNQRKTHYRNSRLLPPIPQSSLTTRSPQHGVTKTMESRLVPYPLKVCTKQTMYKANHGDECGFMKIWYRKCPAPHPFSHT